MPVAQEKLLFWSLDFQRAYRTFETMATKENDEARKLEKRIRAVEAIKAKYTATSSLPYQPEGPDPYEKMSKRTWEKSVMIWRAELRAKLNEHSL